MTKLLVFIMLMIPLVMSGQKPVGLQVDSGQVVLFGKDTMCCGTKWMWLPSKGSVLLGEMVWPYDSIGQLSFAAGKSRASGVMSAALGLSTAEGDNSVALGVSGAIGDRSFAAGNSSAFGLHSAALGQSSASGTGAFSSGFSAAVGILSAALGNGSAYGNSSAAFNLARADAVFCTAVGRYNVGGGSAVDYVSTDPIFEVGIGTSEGNRRNALTIRKDGFISLGNHLGNTKFALYEFNGATYGMGVQAGQFRFNLGNPQARYAFFDSPGGTEIFTVYGNGNALLAGTLTQSSDRNRKENIIPVDYREVLTLLRAIPVTEWQYKGQTERHVGPMAQDFFAAFGLGAGDTTIASIDADGIALAAIKALIGEMESMQAEIRSLKKQLADLARNQTD
jgi:hypothetical protein